MSRKVIQVMLLLVVSILASCAHFGVKQVGEANTLLVVSKANQNISLEQWVRRYSLVIRSLDSGREEVELSLSNNADDYELLQGLSAGDYEITRMKWSLSSRWRGTQAMGEGYALNLRFRIEDDKVTVLPYKLLIRQESSGTGVTSYVDVLDVSLRQRQDLATEVIEDQQAAGLSFLGAPDTLSENGRVST